MSDQFDYYIEQLHQANALESLKSIKRGIEKESLRVSQNGYLSSVPHSKKFGSALTHPFITTDYSESLMELITPPSDDPEQPIKFLNKIHHFVNHQLGDEYLWNASMPCMMNKEEDIPIAEYGTSNIGKMKYIYRQGLGKRYGRLMQTISGVHYNFSLPQEFWVSLQKIEKNQDAIQDFISEKYMGLVRNFQRYSWLLPYLFGASPAICKSFVKGKKHSLKELMPGTLYGEYATSLRMSDMGYSNNAQSRLNINYDHVFDYAMGLEHAIHTPEPLYEKIGLTETIAENKQQRIQLNTNLLQIENEFYSNIRPKRVINSGERPATALKERGVEYIEVRGLDINPFSNVGITEEQIHWLDCFLISCALEPSPKISCREEAENKSNLRRVVNFGRTHQLTLWSLNREVGLKDIANKITPRIEAVASIMDKLWETSNYSKSVSEWHQCFDLPEKTLSGQLMVILKKGLGYYPETRKLSLQIKNDYLSKPIDSKDRLFFQQQSQQSIAKQKEIEQSDSIDFEQFLESYYQ